MNTPESKGCVRVLIVDDHPVVRAGLASLLRRQPGVKLCGAAHSGEEAMELLKSTSAEVILLKADTNPPRAIILSSYELEEEIYKAVKAGARGYLSKNAPREEILTAIETVAGGGTYFPERIVKWMGERDERSSLSAREVEILEMVSRGLTNKEIAGALRISHYTVRNHINHISAKLQVADRTEAATLALRQGIISNS